MVALDLHMITDHRSQERTKNVTICSAICKCPTPRHDLCQIRDGPGWVKVPSRIRFLQLVSVYSKFISLDTGGVLVGVGVGVGEPTGTGTA